MLNETFLYLLLLGIFSLFHTRPRYDTLLAFFITFFCVGIFTMFLFDWKTSIDFTQGFMLDSFLGSNVKFEITSSKHNYMLIFPFFFITISAMVNNLFFKYETQKKSCAMIFVFNILAFIMLIVGNNLIQVITFVFIIDILSQLLIKDSQAGRRYSIYNFFADMGLFLVLAMLEGKLTNLDVGHISHYYETGRHRDFIMFMLMISLSIKFGFFFFQGYWLDLKSAKFHNLYSLPYLSTPMAALILFTKFYPLLVVSPSFLPTLNIMVTLSMLWGAIGSVLNFQIKEKFVYLNMIHMAFVVKLIQTLDFSWNMHFSYLIVLCFIFNLCLYYLHYEIDRNEAQNKLPVYLVLASILMTMIGFECELFNLLTPENAQWIMFFAILWLLSVSSIFTEAIYVTKSPFLWPLKDYHSFFLICFVTSFCFYTCLPDIPYDNFLLFGPVLFAFFILLNPMRSLKIRQNLNKRLQHIDLFALFYKKCIDVPLEYIGFLFHILIEFIFIERTFLPIFSAVNSFLIQTYRRASRIGLLYYLFCTFAGLLLAFYFFSLGDFK